MEQLSHQHTPAHKTVGVVFRATGSKGAEVRGDGNGSFLPRGFYFIRSDGSRAGPFDSKDQAELVLLIEGPRRRKPHESELFAAERNALRALRRKGIVSKVGLYLQPVQQ